MELRSIQWRGWRRKAKGRKECVPGKWSMDHYIDPEDSTKTLCGKSQPHNFEVFDVSYRGIGTQCGKCQKIARRDYGHDLEATLHIRFLDECDMHDVQQVLNLLPAHAREAFFLVMGQLRGEMQGAKNFEAVAEGRAA